MNTDNSEVLIQERGWQGHWPSNIMTAVRCLYSRNTLIRRDTMLVVVSTIGDFRDSAGDKVRLRNGAYYETLIGHAYPSIYGYEELDDEALIENRLELPETLRNSAAYILDTVADNYHDCVVANVADMLIGK